MRVLVIMGLLGAALSCGGTPPPKTGTLSGLVTDPKGQPLPSVDIETEPSSQFAVSASDGTWMLSGVPAGTYTVKASRSGYTQASTAGVVVSSGGSAIVDLTLSPLVRVGTVHGTVRDAKTTTGIAGATVSTTPGAGSTSSAVDGAYSLSLPVGQYALTVEKAGYVSATNGSVSVTADTTTTIDVSMSPVVVYASACVECHVDSAKILADLAADPLPPDLGTENTGEG